MVTQRNSEIIRQLYLEIASRARQVSGAKHKRNARYSRYTVSAGLSDMKAFYDFFTDIGSAFPDFELTIDSLTAKEDQVMSRFTISGTHQGIFMGLGPTHEWTTVTGIDIFRLDNGKVPEHWDTPHQISVLPQLGRRQSKPIVKWNPEGMSSPQTSQKQLSISTGMQ